jgi:hypothetical protein
MKGLLRALSAVHRRRSDCSHPDLFGPSGPGIVTLVLFLMGRFAGIGFDVSRVHVSSLL